MAGPAPSSNVQDFLGLFLKKRWWVILPTLAGLTAGLVVLDFVPRKYESWTRVEVKEVRFEDDPQARLPQNVPYKQLQHVAAQVLASPNLRKTVGERLRWEGFVGIRPEQENEKFIQLRRRTRVERMPKEKDTGSDYVTITYKDEDPRRAADFANHLCEVWRQESRASYQNQIERELEELQKQVEAAKIRADARRKSTSDWVQQHNLRPDIAVGGQRTAPEQDPVVDRYTKLQAEADANSRELIAAQSNLAHWNQLYANEPRVIEVAVAEIARGSEVEKKLQDEMSKLRIERAGYEKDQQGLTKLNKRWDVLQNKINLVDKQMKSVAEALRETVPDAETGPRQIVQNSKKAEHWAQVTQAEEKVQSLQARQKQIQADLAQMEPQKQQRSWVYERYRAHAELERVSSQMHAEEAQKYDRKRNLLAQIKSTAGDPYRIIDPAVPSERPVEPNVGFILMAAMLAGAGLGVGLLFVSEYTRPSFRSFDDAVATLSVPVLGGVNKIVTLSEYRRERWRRTVGIGASLAVLAVIASIASAFLVKPDVLPGPLFEAMNAVKEKLR